MNSLHWYLYVKVDSLLKFGNINFKTIASVLKNCLYKVVPDPVA